MPNMIYFTRFPELREHFFLVGEEASTIWSAAFEAINSKTYIAQL